MLSLKDYEIVATNFFFIPEALELSDKLNLNDKESFLMLFI